MKTNKIEVRTISSSLRAAPKADDFTLEGVACRYNSLSKDLNGFREKVLPGAFALAVASRQDTKCLFNHSQDKVLGRVQNGTLKLTDTPEGLSFRCQLDPTNTEHRNLYQSVKRGDINEMSWAFTLEDGDDDFSEGYDDDGKRCTIRSIRNVSNLFDVSIVTSPAYNSTSVQARSFASKLFRTTMVKSYEELHPAAGEYMLNKYRALRQAAEIRRDAVLYAGSDAGLRDRLEKLGMEIELESYLL
jgi:HK97 family phage prohead protease